MYITCETCGYDNNPSNAEYCEACGAELNSIAPAIIKPNPPMMTPKVIPMTPSEPASASTTCQACGYDNNPADAEYCGACCLLYTSPSPRDVEESRMPSSA